MNAHSRSSLKTASRTRILFGRQLSGIGDGILTADTIGRALDGRRSGGGWVARCPAHDDRTPSLSIQDALDGRVLVYCHAGCEQAHVINALRQRRLWPSNDRHQANVICLQSGLSAQNRQEEEATDRTAAALKIWQSAVAVTNTLAETYLQSRGIDMALPASLRFHPGLRHHSGDLWPAMIALVTRGIDDEPVAIHQTFLARDGKGKAPVVPQKMMLGPCRGAGVRLGTAHPASWMVVAEGIETTLSVMLACGIPGWAALSANGLRSVVLPPDAAKVLICADNDHNGVGQRVAGEAAERFLSEGRRVRIATPPSAGTDFNDVLRIDLGHLDKEARCA